MTTTRRAGPLKLVCADLDVRPLFWTGSGGARHGYEPEVASAVAEYLGWELIWVFSQWSDFSRRLFNGEVDAIWCGSAITPEREQQFLYSRPYAVFNESLLVHADSEIQTIADLKQRRVAAIDASTNMALAQQWPGCECIAFDGASDDVFADMIHALDAGEVDGVVDDEPAFGGLIAKGAYRIAFTVDTANRWGAAMRPEDVALKTELDRALVALQNQDALAAIWRRHFPTIAFPALNE